MLAKVLLQQLLLSAANDCGQRRVGHDALAVLAVGCYPHDGLHQDTIVQSQGFTQLIFLGKQFLGALPHLLFQAHVEGADFRLGLLALGDIGDNTLNCNQLSAAVQDR